MGSESPSSRSSDSFKQAQNRRGSSAGGPFTRHGGSLKKKNPIISTGPEALNSTKTSGDEGSSSGCADSIKKNPAKIKLHTRTPSDPAAVYHLPGHLRNLSIDSTTETGTFKSTKSGSISSTGTPATNSIYASLQRPRCPPPPLPSSHSVNKPSPEHSSNRLSNGRSIESLSAISSGADIDRPPRSSIDPQPVPPPRKVYCILPINLLTNIS